MTWGPSNWNGLTPARPDATPARPDITLARNPTAGATPAQAHGHPSFVVDVPVQGPTDEGMRAASCWWAQNRLPANPACVDCDGPVPQWARNTLCPGNRLTNSGLGEGFMEAISFGGVGVSGFALGQTTPAAAPSAPDVFGSLTSDQQYWVMNTLRDLNDRIVNSSGTSCPAWMDPGVSVPAAVGCFQQWYNANYGPPKAPGAALRTDSVLDQTTLDALKMVVTVYHPEDFPTAFPGAAAPAAPPAPPPAPPTPGAPTAAVTKKEGLSTGAMVGIGVAGAAALGGIVYAATRKPRRRSRRR